jgi:hypothetical protein
MIAETSFHRTDPFMTRLRAGTRDPCITAKYWRDEAARLEDIDHTKMLYLKEQETHMKHALSIVKS